MNRLAGWVFAGVLFAITSQGIAQSARNRVVYTNRKRFAIPFQSDAAEIRRLGANEMRLFVSVDRGKSWQRVQSVLPKVKKFTVQAPRDGAYWFAVRTVDRDNRLHPKKPVSAELKVVVDTQSPTLSLKLIQPNPGQVALNWSAADRHLDADSLTLEAKQAGAAKWRKLQVAARAAGKTTWNLPQGGIVQVRGKIADSAANTAVAEDSIRIAPGKQKIRRPKIPDFNDPIANSSDGDTGPSMPSKFPSQPGPDGSHPFGSTQRPRESDNNVTRNDRSRNSEPGSMKAPPRPGGGKPFTRFPTVSNSRPAKTEIPTKLVNKKEFRLNYKLEQVGKSGVQSVVLYITQDGGRKWYRYGVDEDRTSPISVKVPDDGTYGFALRVRSGVGLAASPPQPGDGPEMLITVDQTPPKLEMLPVLQGQGKDSHKFLIRWRISDENPGEKPIAIAYSEKADGPWQPLADWTESEGKYLWTTPKNAPPKVYIRIAGRDAAGNIAVVQTPRPVIIDDVKPRARITNVDVEVK